jgi:branched-chain amino acid transport system substrate-binding protein
MNLDRRALLGASASAGLLLAPAGHVRAQTSRSLKVGVLSDMSGVYRDVSGPTALACVRQAVQDSGISGRGVSVEVISGDHQNKPDVGSSLARQWFDRDNVDIIVDVPNSAVALAVAGVAREKNKVYVNSGAGTAELTGTQCSPNTIHWAYDTYMLAKSTGNAMVQAGNDTWYFITADYTFGTDLERIATSFVQAAGGKVLGSARHPLQSTDFSSLLLRAQQSRAKVVALANAGTDTINSVKQAQEFGITRRAKVAVLLLFINDLNDRTRAFTSRVKASLAGNMPAMSHAGCYASVLHYLKAAADLGIPAAKASGAEAVARMKAMPCDDDCFGTGRIREDGRKLHPAYLFEVKSPADSRHPWDYYKLLETTSGNDAFRPLSEGNCPLIHS